LWPSLQQFQDSPDRLIMPLLALDPLNLVALGLFNAKAAYADSPHHL